jgi:hypothetical protein
MQTDPGHQARSRTAATALGTALQSQLLISFGAIFGFPELIFERSRMSFHDRHQRVRRVHHGIDLGALGESKVLLRKCARHVSTMRPTTAPLVPK